MAFDLDKELETLARTKMGIGTLETRNSDRLDFHDVAVWGVRGALKAAFEMGARYAADYALDMHRANYCADCDMPNPVCSCKE